MAKLLHEPGGERAPQGKPRVYFCCHPDDFDACFAEIATDILNKQSCTVFYLEDMAAARDDAFFEDLARMQLLVFPITTKLLRTENPALDVDFRFAVEHGIPVLPLMREPGLEVLFNRVCGELQFLDKFAHDTTAISYDVKLSRFLASVLVGDELSARVRAAFDAYIFLSYRKKDRAYAQELMRLIHQNEFCRDIAIWYDEFLVPGENFDGAIRTAIEKSHLFMLAVTPNVLEDGNFVRREEYPLAKHLPKPVFPAELVPTDRGALAAAFEDLPETVDPRDTPVFSQALLDTLRRIAVSGNRDDSPAHLFFIGLAYLGGIDVEVNHARAVALITQAAQGGLAEAMAKLSAMYRSGDAVQRDVKEAALWQKKLAAVYEALFRKEGTPAAATLWLDALLAHAALLHENGSYREAAAACKAVVKHAKAMYKPTVITWEGRLLRQHTARFPYALHVQGAAHLQAGHSHLAAGNHDDAFDRFDDASTAWIDYLVAEQPTREMRLGLCAAFIGIGDVDLEEGSSRPSDRDYLQALADLKPLIDQGADEQADTLQADCHSRLTTVYILQESYSKAAQHCRKALDLRRGLHIVNPSPVTAAALAREYMQMGGLLVIDRQYDVAETCFAEAQRLLESDLLCDTVEAATITVMMERHLGDFYHRASDKAAAIHHYEAACEAAEDCAEPPVKAISACRTALIRLYRETGDFDAETEQYKALAALGQAEGGDTFKYRCKQLADEAVNLHLTLQSKGQCVPLPQAIAQYVGTPEQVSLLQTWCDAALTAADIVLRDRVPTMEQSDAEQAVDRLAEALFDLAPVSGARAARCYLTLAARGYAVLYAHVPYRSEYDDKCARARQKLQKFG